MSKRRSLARRMAANSKPHRFGETVAAVVDGEAPSMVRYSRALGRLTPEAREEFERDRAMAAHCAEHGALDDPAIFLIDVGSDQRVAFACPWCSGPEILAAWEKDGMS